MDMIQQDHIGIGMIHSDHIGIGIGIGMVVSVEPYELEKFSSRAYKFSKTEKLRLHCWGTYKINFYIHLPFAILTSTICYLWRAAELLNF